MPLFCNEPMRLACPKWAGTIPQSRRETAPPPIGLSSAVRRFCPVDGGNVEQAGPRSTDLIGTYGGLRLRPCPGSRRKPCMDRACLYPRLDAPPARSTISFGRFSSRHQQTTSATPLYGSAGYARSSLLLGQGPCRPSFLSLRDRSTFVDVRLQAAASALGRFRPRSLLGLHPSSHP